MRVTWPFIFHPHAGAERLRQHPAWLAQFVVLVILSAGLLILMHPFAVRATLAHLPTSVTPEDADRVRASLDRELVARCLFLPFRQFFGWAGFSLLLFMMCRGFQPSQAIRFSQFFAIEVRAEWILVLGRACGLFRTFLHGHDSSGRVAAEPFGIGGIVNGQESFAVTSLLTSANLFTLWYLVVLVVGVAILCGFRWRKSCLIIAGAWAVTLSCNIGALTLLREAFHLRL
jgi:hypothetical protein